MNYLFILFCLFAVCSATTLPTTARQGVTTARQGATTGRQGVTTGRPSGSTASNALSCVCSCCSGLRCKPIVLRSFLDTTCTTKACKDKCKTFEPTHCDHTFLGTNDAYCTVQF